MNERSGKARTEDDLRRVLAAKAADAPAAADVLRAVRGAERRRPSKLRWLVPAAAAAVAAAITIPLVVSDNGSSAKKSAGEAKQPATRSLNAQSRAVGGAQPSPQPSALALSAAICRPQDVVAALTVHPQGGATLTLTSRTKACSVARVPSLRWQSLTAKPESAGVPTSASEQGRLAAGATASAPVRWSGSCVAPVGTVEVNWGAGDVDVRPTGVPQRKCPAGNRPSDLRVGAFTGLS